MPGHSQTRDLKTKQKKTFDKWNSWIPSPILWWQSDLFEAERSLLLYLLSWTVFWFIRNLWEKAAGHGRLTDCFTGPGEHLLESKLASLATKSSYMAKFSSLLKFGLQKRENRHERNWLVIIFFLLPNAYWVFTFLPLILQAGFKKRSHTTLSRITLGKSNVGCDG